MARKNIKLKNYKLGVSVGLIFQERRIMRKIKNPGNAPEKRGSGNGVIIEIKGKGLMSGRLYRNKITSNTMKKE